MAKMTLCITPDCKNVASARGLCHKHYEYMRYNGILPPKDVKPPHCIAEGCTGKRSCRNLCKKHYMRLWRHGHVGESNSGKYARHGMYDTPTYRSWHSMLRRCHNPKNPIYAKYGAKNIQVCERWRNSFKAFYEDMGVRPEGKTIHRIDPDGNYEPGNCKWATRQEQNRQLRLRKTNKSGYRGVHYSRGAWVANIRIDNRPTHIGCYETKEEAAVEYDQAALVHFVAEAVLNKV